MNVYIDKQNLVSYVHSMKDSRFEDCNSMLKKCCDINFTFTKYDLDQLDQEDDRFGKEALVQIKLWMSTMMQGCKGKVRWGINFPPRPLKTNMHNNFSHEDLSAVYLLDDEKVITVKNMGSIIVDGPGGELSALSQLIINDDNLYTKMFNPRELESWDILDAYISPATDIIIVDRFLALDESLYESNLYALVEKLAIKSKCKLNYIIFSDDKDRASRVAIAPDWDNIRSKIKRKVKNITGYDPNVTFILKYKVEHDRTVFTNYKLFHSGDTCNYFNSKGELITKGRYLNIDSIASKDCRKSCSSFIEDMQAVINDVIRINSDLIKGDKKSCFLKFEQPVQL